jgi:hypothetical protein
LLLIKIDHAQAEIKKQGKEWLWISSYFFFSRKAALRRREIEFGTTQGQQLLPETRKRKRKQKTKTDSTEKQKPRSGGLPPEKQRTETDHHGLKPKHPAGAESWAEPSSRSTSNWRWTSLKTRNEAGLLGTESPRLGRMKQSDAVLPVGVLGVSLGVGVLGCGRVFWFHKKKTWCAVLLGESQSWSFHAFWFHREDWCGLLTNDGPSFDLSSLAISISSLSDSAEYISPGILGKEDPFFSSVDLSEFDVRSSEAQWASEVASSVQFWASDMLSQSLLEQTLAANEYKTDSKVPIQATEQKRIDSSRS